MSDSERIVLVLRPRKLCRAQRPPTERVDRWLITSAVLQKMPSNPFEDEDDEESGRRRLTPPARLSRPLGPGRSNRRRLERPSYIASLPGSRVEVGFLLEIERRP
jgi:hypothetical protein